MAVADNVQDVESETYGIQKGQDVLSGVVKGVHAHLRAEFATGGSLSEMWGKHLQDSSKLQTYASAMHALATGPWSKHGGGRIQWCVDVCKEYFYEGKLKSLLEKDLRRQYYGNETILEPQLIPKVEDVSLIIDEFRSRKLRLLDVGSCYNPFHEYKEFEVTAIDIAPAIKKVLQCDFLMVEITSQNQENSDSKSLNYIRPNSFDIVIFSLLLSYFPSTEQRMQCCVNAHKVLVPHGILLIITPDSSHQNRHAGMIKSWRSGIEALGFHRWKYVKDTHLHCMAFRRTRTPVDYNSVHIEHHVNLYIPQDSVSLDQETMQSYSLQKGLEELPTHFDEDSVDYNSIHIEHNVNLCMPQDSHESISLDEETLQSDPLQNGLGELPVQFDVDSD